LRGRSLIQTIGRAARHVRGQAILYADNLTDSMAKQLNRAASGNSVGIQRKHGITQPILKKITNNIFLEVSRRLNAQQLETVYEQVDDMPLEQIPELITQLGR